MKALHERWLKLVQLAQDELSQLVQSPDSSLLELEAAVNKYKEYPPEVQLVYSALLKKNEAFVRQAEDRLTRLLTSFNVRYIDQALTEYRNSCAALQPLVEKLDSHRLEACLNMSTKMQEAARGSDVMIIAQILEESKDYGRELQVERDALQDRFEWLLGDAKGELTEMLKSNNIGSIIQCLEKVQAYPSSVEHLRDKLQRHKETLISETRLRFAELCVGEDPQEIVLQINLTEDYAAYMHEERQAAQTRLADLLRQARAQMRNILQDTGASLREVETVLARYADYPADVQQVRASLMTKRDALADSACELLASLQQSSDIEAINEGFSKFAGSSDTVKSAVQMLENHRAGLCRGAAKQMRAAASGEDLVEMYQLLQQADQYSSDEVLREKKALQLRYQTVTELVITDIRDLCRAKDFARVDFACEKYKGYPEVVRPRWQELMGHRKALLEQARRELEKARKGSHPAKISAALAAVEKYGKAIAPERVALQARWSELVHNAHKDMLALVQNKQATVDLIELKLRQYEEFPRDVDEVRRKLRDKCESLQSIKAELSTLCQAQDPNEILAALQEFMQYGAAVSGETEALQTQFRHLMRTARTNMRNCVQNPEALIAEMQKMLAAYENYPEDVAAVRAALQKNFDRARTLAKDRLIKLLSSNSAAEIDAALAEYAVASKFLDNAVENLENHRERLCLELAARMEEVLGSTDLREIHTALSESEAFGTDMQQLREALARHYNGSLEKISARLHALCQSDDCVLIDEALDQYANHVDDLRQDWERLKRHREDLVDKARRSLRALVTCEEPSQIDAALDSCEGIAEEVQIEVTELHARRQALIEEARTTMSSLVEGEGVIISEVSAFLHKYRFFPDEGETHELRHLLAAKHDTLLASAQKELAELGRSDDIERIDATIRMISGSDPSMEAGLRDLERHRTELVRAMSVKVQTAVGYDDPHTMMSALDESIAYEDDIHAERGALKARYDNAIATANEELERALTSEDYGVVSAVLKQYETYPGEVKQRWQALHAHMSTLRQDTLEHVQRALASRDSREIDALLRKLDHHGGSASAENGGGGDLDKYREMLQLRRAKLLDSARQSIRQALSSSDLHVLDRVFEENAHLVNEFPKEYFSALRKHRDGLVAMVRGKVQRAIEGFNLVGACAKCPPQLTHTGPSLLNNARTRIDSVYASQPYFCHVICTSFSKTKWLRPQCIRRDRHRGGAGRDGRV